MTINLRDTMAGLPEEARAAVGKRSAEIHAEIEAMGELTEICVLRDQDVHGCIGSIALVEDAHGVFWLDMDGDMTRVDEATVGKLIASLS